MCCVVLNVCEFVWKVVGREVVGVFVIVVIYSLVAVTSRCKNI